ncbi:unnamed protein product, partial [Iphiclides podalirius]
MPDGEGVPHLVDLHEEPDEDVLRKPTGVNNQYWLYTRSNPDTAQNITHGDEDSIRNSFYNGSKALAVTVHGWISNGNSDMNTLITSAFLDVLDTNVIVVDWSNLASSNYISATYGVPSVGEYLGNFLVWLIDTAGGDWNRVHLVGFSLGAHVVGAAGRTARGLAARVTACSGPLLNICHILNVSLFYFGYLRIASIAPQLAADLQVSIEYLCRRHWERDAAVHAVSTFRLSQDSQSIGVRFIVHQLHQRTKCDPHGLSHVELLSFCVQAIAD